jgi:hypothetical protein
MNGFSRRAVRQPVLEKREKWRTPANAHCAGSVVPTLAQKARKDGAPSASSRKAREVAHSGKRSLCGQCGSHPCATDAQGWGTLGGKVGQEVNGTRTGVSAPHMQKPRSLES